MYNGEEWTINQKFKDQLDILLHEVKNDDMDLVIVICGKEGSGKSFIARGLGSYCAYKLGTSYGVNDIEFNLYEYVNHSLKKGKFMINHLDESRKIAGRAKVRDKDVEFFLDYLSECRSKNQVHIVCIPAFHDLKPYLVLWRMRLLIECKKRRDKDESSPVGYKLVRGEYKVYTDLDSISWAYDNKYKYPKVWNVYAEWSRREVFSPEMLKAYNDKKDDYTIKKYGKGVNYNVNEKGIELSLRDNIVNNMVNKGLNNCQIADYLGIGETTVRASRRRLSNKDSTGSV